MGRNTERPRRDAIALAVAEARKIMAGEFAHEPSGNFRAAQRIEHLLTDYSWLDNDYPSALADFIFGWNVSGDESDRAIVASARELIEQTD